MNTPYDKSVEQWTFNELVNWAAWHVVQGMLQGKTLQMTMHHVVSTVGQWHSRTDLQYINPRPISKRDEEELEKVAKRTVTKLAESDKAARMQELLAEQKKRSRKPV